MGRTSVKGMSCSDSGMGLCLLKTSILLELSTARFVSRTRRVGMRRFGFEGTRHGIFG